MGNAGSDGVAPDPPTAEEAAAYERVFRGEVDAKAVFEQAFINEGPEAVNHLNRIVEELEGKAGDAKKVTEEMRKLQEMVDELERREKKARRAAELEATAKADSWLTKQMRDGEAAEAQALAEKARRTQERLAKEEADAATASKAAEREVAKAEAAARAALFEEAADFLRRAQASATAALMSAVPLPLPECPPLPPETDDPPPNPFAAVPRDEIPEFYKILAVQVEATFEEIKKAYRKQALLWHPDKNRHRLDEATERFQRINEAFDTLYDPGRRSSYDAGEIKTPGKVKKLAGSGWSTLTDEDDAALTPLGVKYRKQSWRGYVLMYGRIDDDPDQIVQDDRDPRAPQEKIKIFWRFLGEMAYMAREESGANDWLYQFVLSIWKDTPNRWPKALELKTMNEAAQEEWKDRRMVYNRRKQKLLVAIHMHEEYLAIPDREKKELERLEKRRPGWKQRMEGIMSTDPNRV